MNKFLYIVDKQIGKQKIYLFLLFSLFLSSFPLLAQTTDNHYIHFTLPEVALIDVEPENQPFTLSLGESKEAGLPIGGGVVTDNSKWINYTSAVPPSTTRSITVQLTGGNLPEGLLLKLKAQAASGSGAGALGNSVGAAVPLSNMPVTIITGIGGAYTGDGVGNGHQLVYTLEVTDMGKLKVGTTSLSVLFTLSDAM